MSLDISLKEIIRSFEGLGVLLEKIGKFWRELTFLAFFFSNIDNIVNYFILISKFWFYHVVELILTWSSD